MRAEPPPAIVLRLRTTHTMKWRCLTLCFMAKPFLRGIGGGAQNARRAAPSNRLAIANHTYDEVQVFDFMFHARTPSIKRACSLVPSSQRRLGSSPPLSCVTKDWAPASAGATMQLMDVVRRACFMPTLHTHPHTRVLLRVCRAIAQLSPFQSPSRE
jgi:hypothetical protein